MPDSVIGVDIGGTKIAVGLVDADSGALLSQVKGDTPRGGNEKILFCMGDLIDEIIRTAPGYIRGIGVGVPGSVDREEGIARSAGNLDFKDMDIRVYIQGRFGVPAYIENDTNAGIMGEKYFGWGRNYRNFIYIAIGTGIGSGMIFDGKLYLGKGDAGEIGHMIVDPSKPNCYCGSPGCLESLASGSAIAREALARLQTGTSSVLRDILEKQGKVKAEDVIQAAKERDILALEIMEDVGRYLSFGLISVVRLLDPEVIIIGGGISHAGDFLRDLILSKVSSIELKKRLEHIIHFSTLNSGVAGAAAVVLEHNNNYNGLQNHRALCRKAEEDCGCCGT